MAPHNPRSDEQAITMPFSEFSDRVSFKKFFNGSVQVIGKDYHVQLAQKYVPLPCSSVHALILYSQSFSSILLFSQC